MYIRASEKAFTATNIKSGWQSTGLEPLIVVLDKHRPEVASSPSLPHMPAYPASVDLTLLNSSPPGGTKVKKVMALFNSELRRPSLFISPAKLFGERMNRFLERA